MEIKRPIITEKSMGLASRGWYTFAVATHTRKEEIAKEIEKMYHVNVTTIRTVTMHGKVRRAGKKMVASPRADWKKAMVQLKAGQKIDAFEVTASAEEPKKEEKPKVEEAQVVEKKVAKKKPAVAKAKAAK